MPRSPISQEVQLLEQDYCKAQDEIRQLRKTLVAAGEADGSKVRELERIVDNLKCEIDNERNVSQTLADSEQHLREKLDGMGVLERELRKDLSYALQQSTKFEKRADHLAQVAYRLNDLIDRSGYWVNTTGVRTKDYLAGVADTLRLIGSLPANAEHDTETQASQRRLLDTMSRGESDSNEDQVNGCSPDRAYGRPDGRRCS